MKRWPTRLSHWLALVASMTIAAEMAFIELERRKSGQLASQWRQQVRQHAELGNASPAITREIERAMADELVQWKRVVAALRAELFPELNLPAGDRTAEDRIDAYFDVAALLGRLRARAAAANVIVKPGESFGFEAYANEAPAAAETVQLRRQCLVVEAILDCLFSGRPTELVSVRGEADGLRRNPGGRQQKIATPKRGEIVRKETGFETMAFRVDFHGDTAALRTFLGALAQSEHLLIAQSIEVVPVDGAKTQPVDSRKSVVAVVAHPTLSRFAVTVECIRPAEKFAPLPP